MYGALDFFPDISSIFALIPLISMVERIEDHEGETTGPSVKNIQVKGAGETTELSESTGTLRREGGFTVVADDVDGQQTNRAVDAAAAEKDVVAVELSNVEGGLTAELVRDLLQKNRRVRAKDSTLLVRGVAAEQIAEIRQLESAGIRVETREKMRKSAGLNVADSLAA